MSQLTWTFADERLAASAVGEHGLYRLTCRNGHAWHVEFTFFPTHEGHSFAVRFTVTEFPTFAAAYAACRAHADQCFEWSAPYPARANVCPGPAR